jgi:uridine kinase
MHNQFVEPSKKFAQTIVHDLGEYKEVLEEFVNRLSKK